MLKLSLCILCGIALPGIALPQETSGQVAVHDVFNSLDKHQNCVADTLNGARLNAADRGARWEKLLSSARELMAEGSYARAEQCLSAARSYVAELRTPEDSARLSATDNVLASLRQDNGRYADAEVFYLRSVDTWQKAYGDNDPGLVRLLNDLASLYLEMKQYGKAERTCEHSLRIQEHAPQLVSSADVARTLMQVGALQRAFRQYPEAESAYLRAEDILNRQGGTEDGESATVWNNLAVLYAQWKQPRKATVYAERSIARAGNSCSPGGTLILTNLAVILADNRLLADAENAFRRASDCAMRAFGPAHPQTGEVLSRFAVFLRKTKRKAEATQMESKAHEIQEKAALDNRTRFTVDVRDLQAANRAPDTRAATAHR